MEKQNKCSVEEHKEINAIKYCPQCRINLCNKCENYHLFLFKNHQLYNINKESDDIFTGYCKEKNHPMKLEYFCKSHNKLCCAVCLCKLNKDGYGQHKDCEICYLENIKEEKKNKLIENIKCLEELEIKFNDSLNELKEILIKIEKNKEELKLNVLKIFTKIRNAINEREDQLLLIIDNKFNNQFINDEIIKKGERLPKKIKESLEKGKKINTDWNNNNLLTYINDSINIENNIKEIKLIKEDINKCNENDKIIKFKPKEDSLNNLIETIKSFGEIYNSYKYSFRECPQNLNGDKKYIVTGDKRNIITKKGKSQVWVGIICENELDKSIEEHKWKIKILKTYQNDYMVGVAPIDFDIYSSSFYNCGWYYHCYYSALYSGPPFNYCRKSSGLPQANTEIIVVMNMKKRSLKFIIDNVDKGDSYINIPIDNPLFPTVFLCDENDSLEIIECQ